MSITNDFPKDHEDLYHKLTTAVTELGKSKCAASPERLIIEFKSIETAGNDYQYWVLIDLRRYSTPTGEPKPVFSLYNLGLQSWSHDVKVTGITYFDPTSENPITNPTDLVRFVKGFPNVPASHWSTAPPYIPKSGAIRRSSVPSQPREPEESEIWFMQSPKHTLFRLEVSTVNRKFVGTKMEGMSGACPKETSHGNIPPPIPPGSSDDGNN